MASTYSNLKIQLMATGENSGTWGTVTNVNLGTAIEEAIVGSADVTFSSADVTLTLTDSNATQTARNLRLNLIGVSGGARQLIVPAIEKVYIINNGLADTVTVKNSTGNGIAVPAGKTMWVYNTGSNVVDATTHLTSLTLGTPLAVAQGGTGSNTGTFSGANITSLNASNISSGTIANDRTTASSSNGASTIVSRDASGNFGANVITANSVSANGSSITAINASNISSGVLALARLPSWSILQVVSKTVTSTSVVTGNSFTPDSNFTISIIPTSASSKILYMIFVPASAWDPYVGGGFRIVRDGNILGGVSAGSRGVVSFPLTVGLTENQMSNNTWFYLDSPATTSSVSYTFAGGFTDNNGSMGINRTRQDLDNNEYLRGQTNILLIELAG